MRKPLPIYDIRSKFIIKNSFSSKCKGLEEYINLLLTIILPVHNSKPYLHNCLESLLNQQIEDFELIIINDGSSDGSEGIIRSYADQDSRIRYIYQVQQGVSQARNKGIELARGDYLGFVDSDDWVEPNMFSCMIDSLLRTNAGFAICEYIHEPKGTYKNFSQWDFPVYINDFTSIHFKRILHSSFSNMVWNKLFIRKNIIQNNISFPSDMHYGEDTIFVYRYLSTISDFCLVPLPLYHYRYRENSLSNGYDCTRYRDELSQADCRYRYTQDLKFAKILGERKHQDRILDITSRNISRFHIFENDQQVTHEKLTELKKHLVSRGRVLTPLKILLSKRPIIDKLKLMLFSLSCFRFLTTLLRLFNERYRHVKNPYPRTSPLMGKTLNQQTDSSTHSIENPAVSAEVSIPKIS